MRIGVLGTGVVGRTRAGAFADRGHQVVVGTRDVDATMARSEPDQMGNPPFAVWAAEHADVRLGTFAEAKAVVTTLLGDLGWPSSSVIDLGGIRAARSTEMYLPLWLSLMSHLGTPVFNIRVVQG